MLVAFAFFHFEKQFIHFVCCNIHSFVWNCYLKRKKKLLISVLTAMGLSGKIDRLMVLILSF